MEDNRYDFKEIAKDLVSGITDKLGEETCLIMIRDMGFDPELDSEVYSALGFDVDDVTETFERLDGGDL